MARYVLAGAAQGDAHRLLGRFAAILIWLSIRFAAMALGASSARVPMVKKQFRVLYREFLCRLTLPCRSYTR